MILTGYCRLGADAELRKTNDDTPVANLSLAFDYGRRDDQGNRQTQWVRAALFGQRAESLIDYLVKGQGLDVVIEDVHVEMFEGRDGPGAALVGRIVLLEFAGKPPQGEQQQRGNNNGRAQQQQQGNNGRTQQGGQQRQQQGNQQQRGNGNGRGRNEYEQQSRGGRTQQRNNDGYRDDFE